MTRKRREQMFFAAAIVVWFAIVYLRANFTEPGEVTWFFGVGSAAIAMLIAGYVLRGLLDRGRRSRLTETA
jgi:quinol-cytochrome oxidoreductase complex cytochrome b subunit